MRFSNDSFACVMRQRAEFQSSGQFSQTSAQSVPDGMSGKAWGEIAPEIQLHGMIGACDKMRQFFALFEKILSTDGRVLIHGESGTGKELVARTLHRAGPRKHNAYVVVDCGTLPTNLIESELFGHVQGAFTGANREKRGLLEAADKGTLFLDEIASLPMDMQSNLLRVLQEGEIRPLGATRTRRIDVRIIAADSRNLRAEVAAGRFREDLFYRLNVLNLTVPPLRERREDIMLLANHFLHKLGDRYGKAAAGFTDETVSLLQDYSWPGNVRELENAVERTVILLDNDEQLVPFNLLPEEVLNPHALPGAAEANHAHGVPVKSKKDRFERRILIDTLGEHRWNQSAAARALGITEGALRYKMKKFSILRPGKGMG